MHSHILKTVADASSVYDTGRTYKNLTVCNAAYS